MRTGDNPGEHTIIFGMLGETLELTVRASNRDCYAHGALAAAKFLAGKPAACTASTTCWDCRTCRYARPPREVMERRMSKCKCR